MFVRHRPGRRGAPRDPAGHPHRGRGRRQLLRAPWTRLSSSSPSQLPAPAPARARNGHPRSGKPGGIGQVRQRRVCRTHAAASARLNRPRPAGPPGPRADGRFPPQRLLGDHGQLVTPAVVVLATDAGAVVPLVVPCEDHVSVERVTTSPGGEDRSPVPSPPRPPARSVTRPTESTPPNSPASPTDGAGHVVAHVTAEGGVRQKPIYSLRLAVTGATSL
jgi:hypothetical protein